jgi:hypothetical protein
VPSAALGSITTGREIKKYKRGMWKGKSVKDYFLGISAGAERGLQRAPERWEPIASTADDDLLTGTEEAPEPWIK